MSAEVATPRQTSEGLRDATLVFASFIIVQGASLIAYRALAHPMMAAIVAVIVVPYATILTLVLWLRRMRHPWFALGSFTRAVRRGWWMAIAAGIAIASGYTQGEFGTTSWAYRLQLVVLVLVGPVCEEVVFRGAMQTALAKTRLGAWTLARLRGSTLAAAVLFGAMHLLLLLTNTPGPRVAFEAISALAPGLIFGYIYQRTDNIWYGVILHALGNLGGA